MKYPLRGFSIHDLHLGHRRVPTKEITDKVRKHVFRHPSFQVLDLFLFPGDIFDLLLQFNDEDTYEIKRFVREFLKLCKTHDITVLMVEGTPRHDRKQSKIFLVENEDIGADILFVDNISVHYLEKFDMHVLFVPDQMGTPEQVYDEALKALKAKGISQADIALFHGGFAHRFPSYLKIAAHNPDLWNPLVKHFIFTGHIHTACQRDKIVEAGSFDRLKHGEEEPKGFFHFNLLSDDQSELEWIENPDAHIFKTIDVSNKPLQEALETIDKEVEGLPSESFIRVHCRAEDTIKESLLQLKKRYLEYYWQVDVIEDKHEKIEKTFELPSADVDVLEITKDNLHTLVEEELQLKYGHLTTTERDFTLQLLQEIVTGVK